MFVQGLSERMSFLKLLVLGTESPIRAQICGKISIKGRHFYISIKETLTRFGKNFQFLRNFDTKIKKNIHNE